jgi:hypothetical protein
VVCTVKQSSGFQRGYYSVTVTWLLVYPEEGLLLGAVSIPCHEDVISSALPRIHGDCKVTAEIMAQSKCKMKEMPGFSPAFS